MSARKNIYNHIKSKGLNSYSSEELSEVGEISEWARVLRQLKQDRIIAYEFDRSSGVYEVSEINPYYSKTTRSGLSSKDKYRIRNRDGHRCQSCGKGVTDGIKLHIDHKIPKEFGGTDTDDNLWVLCDYCNQGKKHFFEDDFDAKVMSEVFKQTSGYRKLKTLFELSPGKEFTPSIIQGISGIRDWTRSIRHIREKEGINIQWFQPDEEHPNGYYSNVE